MSLFGLPFFQKDGPLNRSSGRQALRFTRNVRLHYSLSARRSGLEILLGVLVSACGGILTADGYGRLFAQTKTTPVSETPPQKSEELPAAEVFSDLLTKDLSEHWRCYNSDMAIPVEDVWKIAAEAGTDGDKTDELVLICTGQPKGFLYTTESYADFELTLEWKFPTDVNGNSGVLVFAQDEPRIWPTSMQVQLHQPKAGSVIPSGDARSDGTTDKTDLARPINSWNECRIISKGGRLTVEINGTSAGDTTGITPASGRIGLQSEGSEVHFRRIKIRPVPEETALPSV